MYAFALAELYGGLGALGPEAQQGDWIPAHALDVNSCCWFFGPAQGLCEVPSEEDFQVQTCCTEGLLANSVKLDLRSLGRAW